MRVVVNVNATDLADLGSSFPQLGSENPTDHHYILAIAMGGGTPSSIVNQSFQAEDSINWTSGRHSIKAGFEMLHLRYLNRSYSNIAGGFTFSGIITGNPAADFLLGKAQTLTVASPLLEQACVGTNFYSHIQDDWKVTSRLTLNLGLRYELPLPWVHPEGEWGTLHVGQQSTVIPTSPRRVWSFRATPIPPADWCRRRRTTSRRVSALPGVRSATAARRSVELTGSSTKRSIRTSFRTRANQTAIPSRSISQASRWIRCWDNRKIPLSLNLKNPPFVGLQQIFYPDPTMRIALCPAVQPERAARSAERPGGPGRLLRETRPPTCCWRYRRTRRYLRRARRWPTKTFPAHFADFRQQQRTLVHFEFQL